MLCSHVVDTWHATGHLMIKTGLFVDAALTVLVHVLSTVLL